jgi:hypothetical protein
MNTGLNEVAIHGFALRWDLQDLVKAMGDRPVMWTDPTDWMTRVAARGPRFQYRWVLGDLTDMSDVQDMGFARELLR